MQEFGVFEWKRKSEKPPNEKVISTKMFHKAKGDEVRSRIVAREFADGVFAPEHHAGTPPTWALKLVISRMMSKGRTRQLASHDVSVAFFHAWLERGVWVKPPKDLRLNDDWLWYVVKALYGMRESSKAFQEVVREMYTTYKGGPCCRLYHALLTAVDSTPWQDGTETISTQKVSPAHWTRSMR